MGKTLKSRLVAYQANGSKLGLLPERLPILCRSLMML